MVETKSTLIKLAEKILAPPEKALPKRSILCWQGYPVDRIYIVLEGGEDLIHFPGRKNLFFWHSRCWTFDRSQVFFAGWHSRIGCRRVVEATELSVLSPDEFDHASSPTRTFPLQ